jgi:DNA-directed RNA polymerase beta' subunit
MASAGRRTVTISAPVKREEKIEEDETRRLTKRERVGEVAIYEGLLSNLADFEISSIFSSIYDPFTIRRNSVVSVTRTLAQVKASQDQSYSNTVKDPKLGPSILNRICAKCSCSEARCPGHNGHIELKAPVYKVAYITEIIDILTCICRDCGRLLLNDAILKSDPKFTLVSGADLLRKVAKASQSLTCMRPDCIETKREYEGEIDRTKSIGLFKIQIKREGKHKEIETERVYKLLRDLPDKDYRKIGYRIERAKIDENQLTPSERQMLVKEGNTTGVSLTTHPKNYVEKVLFVPPNKARGIKIIKGMPQENDLTLLYDQIAKDNLEIEDLQNRISDARRRNDEKQLYSLNSDLQSKIDGMQMRIAQILDSDKYKTSISRMDQLKGVQQELQGKRAKIRSGMMAKPTNSVARNVAGPDPFLMFGEVSVPEIVANKQTYREEVFSGNLIALTRLLRQGDVLYYERNSNIKIEVTPEFVRTGKLEIGMAVYRRAMNGDVIINNRFPSIHMYSIQAATMRRWKRENMGENLAYSSALKLDFDGDEVQAHFPQTYAAQADAIAGVHIRRNIINAQNSTPLAAGVYNVPVATTLLSQPGVTVSEQDFSYMLIRLVSQDQLPSLYSRLARHSQPVSILVKPTESKPPTLFYWRFLRETNPEPFLNADDARLAFLAWARGQNIQIELSAADFDRLIAIYFANPDSTYRYFLIAQQKLPGGQVVFSSFSEAFAEFKKWHIAVQEHNLIVFTELQRVTETEVPTESAERAEFENRVLGLFNFFAAQHKLRYKITTLAEFKELWQNEDFQREFVSLAQQTELALRDAQKLTQEQFIQRYLPGYINQNGVYEIYTQTNLRREFGPDAELPVEYPVTSSTIVNNFQQWLTNQNLPGQVNIEELIGFLIQKYGQPLSAEAYRNISNDKIERELNRKLTQIEERRKLRLKQLETLEGIFRQRKQMQLDQLVDLEKDVRIKYEREKDRLKHNLAPLKPDDKIWLGLGISGNIREEVRYPGNVVLSMILPATLNYNEYGIVIRDGVVIEGVFTGDVVGTNKNSLVQSIFHNYGSERASDFITDLYFISYAIYTPLNMTISLADLSDTDPTAVLAVEENKAKLMRRVQALAATYPSGDDPILQERHEREMLQLTRDFANIGAKVVEALNASNNISLIIQSKAKGKPAEFSRMMVDLQQMTINGQRLPTTLAGGTRRLPYYSKGEKSLEAGGFVNNSYIRGTEPDEYYQHAEGSRLGIVESQVKTPDVGDDHRRLVKRTEDMRLAQTNAVVDQAVGNIIGFIFGNHSLSPIHLRMTAMRGTNIASPFYPKELLARINNFYGRVLE